MPSPRREIESRIRHILPVAVLADVAASEAVRGLTRHESRNSQRAYRACGALCGSLLDLTIFLAAAVTRFDHCAADSEAQPHSAGFTGLLGLGRGKYNNILQQL